MAHTHVIDKSSPISNTLSVSISKTPSKAARRLRKQRDARLVDKSRAELRREIEHEVREELQLKDAFAYTSPHHASSHGEMPPMSPMSPMSPRATQPHFDDVVMQANSAAEVHRALAALPEGADMKSELSRAIAARYRRLERDMGFATTGLRRTVCLGAMCMSVVGLALAVSGLHLGALSIVAGAGVLALFVGLALTTYLYRCVWYRYTKQGKIDLAQHREVLDALRSLCKEHDIMPDSTSRILLDRCRAVINGHVGFVALEVLRGTILEPLISAGIMGKRKLSARRLRRQAEKENLLASVSR